MARPLTDKLPRLPLETGFLGNDEILRLTDKFKALGLATYIVLQDVVFQNGSYARMNRRQLIRHIEYHLNESHTEQDESKNSGKRRKKATVGDVIDYFVEEGILDGESLRAGIVTSRWMQQAHLDSCTAMRRGLNRKNYWLLEDPSKDGGSEDVLKSPKNHVSATETTVITAKTAVSDGENAVRKEINRKEENIIPLSHPSIQGKPGGSEDEDGWDRRRMPPSGRKKRSVPDITAMVRSIRERIEYPILTASHYSDKGTIDTMVNILLETELANTDTLTVSGIEYPAEFVKNRLAGIDSGHIEYVLDCLSSAGKIRNIKHYLLAALFNAPATIDGSCEAEVRRDMPWIMQG